MLTRGLASNHVWHEFWQRTRSDICPAGMCSVMRSTMYSDICSAIKPATFSDICSDIEWFRILRDKNKNTDMVTWHIFWHPFRHSSILSGMSSDLASFLNLFSTLSSISSAILLGYLLASFPALHLLNLILSSILSAICLPILFGMCCRMWCAGLCVCRLNFLLWHEDGVEAGCWSLKTLTWQPEGEVRHRLSLNVCFRSSRCVQFGAPSGTATAHPAFSTT